MKTTGWAELYAHREWKFDHPKDCTPKQIAYREMHRHSYGTCSWKFGDLTVHDHDWNEIETLSRERHEFRVRDHSRKDGTGGHNWYMTARFDVWFVHLDGWTWFGSLITGGDNSVFKVRRTLGSVLLRPPLPWNAIHTRKEPHPLRHAFKHPRIEPDAGDTLRIADGTQTKWFAKLFEDGWHFGSTIGEVFASRLLREAA